MESKKYEIKCDECGNTIDLWNDESVRTLENIKFDDKTFNVTYFKCEQCGRIYIVEMLDYKANKMKNKYLAISESVKKKQISKLNVSEERLQELEKAKQDAISYQHWLLVKYGQTVETEIVTNTN